MGLYNVIARLKELIHKGLERGSKFNQVVIYLGLRFNLLHFCCFEILSAYLRLVSKANVLNGGPQLHT